MTRLESRVARKRRDDQLAPKSQSRWRAWGRPSGFGLGIGAGFILRLIYLWQIDAIPLFYNLAGDGRAYDDWAQRIAAGDWWGQGVFYQPPLYPYFLGAVQTIFGHNLWLVRL